MGDICRSLMRANNFALALQGTKFKSALAIMAFLFVFSIPAFASFSISIASPTNTTYTTTFSNPVSIPVNFSFAGNEAVAPPCFWQLDDGTLIQLTLCQNFTNSFAVGFHSLRIYANSSLTGNSTARNFTVFTNFTFFNTTINNIIEGVLIPTIADTWVSNGENAATGCNKSFLMTGSAPDGTGGIWGGTNATTNHGNDTYIALDAVMLYQFCWSSPNADITSLWKFNTTNASGAAPYAEVVQNKIILSAQFQPIGIGGCSSADNKTAYWSPNAGDWNESNITQENCGSACTLSSAGRSQKETISGFSSTWTGDNFVNTADLSNFFSAPALVQAIYNGSLVTMAMDETQNAAYSCVAQNGWSSMHWTQTREAPTPNIAQLNFTLGDYITTGNDYPLFSSVYQEFFYDFETGSINSQGAQSATPLSSTFPQADFKWSLSNILTPLNGATAVVVASQNDATNTLANTACSGETGYSSSPISSLNIPAGQYYVICFNLSASHNGAPFFGAIKVTNAQTNQILGVPTGGDFQFWAAIYSPAFSSFSIPTRIPATVNGGDNVTYFWTSSQPVTTGVQYFITPSGGITTVITLVSDANLTLSHAYTISGALLAPATQVTFRVFGVSNDSTTSWSPFIDTFTVAGATGIQSNLTNIIQPINGGSGGLGIFPFSEQSITISGFVSLDGGEWIHTTLEVCENCTFQVLVNDTSSFLLYRPLVNVVQYTPDLATVGSHNVKIRDDSGYRYRDFNFTIPYNPYALALRVLPNTCVPYSFWGTQTFCDQDRISLNISSVPDATGQFCQFNPTECQLFNNSNGQCLQLAQHISTTGSGLLIGGWVHYVCFNNANSGYYNLSIVNGTPLTGGTSPNDQVGNTIGNILGISPDAAKAVIAMILIMLITGFMAIKTKDGLITGLFFEGGMGLFLLWGWLPLWFLIIFGVLAAFMIAKFARGLLTPSEG